jgi:amino acid permease
MGLSENKCEEEQIREAIRREEKWRRLTLPIILMFLLLFMVLVCLNQAVLGIVLLLAVFPILMSIPSFKTSMLLGFHKIKQLELHPEEKNLETISASRRLHLLYLVVFIDRYCESLFLSHRSWVDSNFYSQDG